jgi:uncharacterized protein (TIGR00106 family)
MLVYGGDIVIIAALSVFPVGVGTSLSQYVKASVKAVDESGLTCEPGSMATTIEAETLDDLFSVVKQARDAQLKLGAKRVYLVLTIDDRRDKDATMKTKLKAIS